MPSPSSRLYLAATIGFARLGGVATSVENSALSKTGAGSGMEPCPTSFLPKTCQLNGNPLLVFHLCKRRLKSVLRGSFVAEIM